LARVCALVVGSVSRPTTLPKPRRTLLFASGLYDYVVRCMSLPKMVGEDKPMDATES
jgi:hypothetical protein